MNSNETVPYSVPGFDNQMYKLKQSSEIKSRVDKFPNGHLFLEIGGKFLFDAHASRVLPGFDPEVKVSILKNLGIYFDIFFCINAIDIERNRQLKNTSQDYITASFEIAKSIEKTFNIRPKIVINNISNLKEPKLVSARKRLVSSGYDVYNRFFIDKYPADREKILSKEGYGRDDNIPLKSHLVLVTGAASNSGKMSTCLGMIYKDNEKGLDSGYAKYETFPIWNLPLKHPINLAYEASTADIGDHNVIDIYHLEAYGRSAVNYNRDISAFRILKSLGKDFIKSTNYLNQYKSPTDMGINMAGFAITNDYIVSIASYKEIQRRKKWYTEMINRGDGKRAWIKICDELSNECTEYFKEKGYDPILGV